MCLCERVCVCMQKPLGESGPACPAIAPAKEDLPLHYTHNLTGQTTGHRSVTSCSPHVQPDTLHLDLKNEIMCENPVTNGTLYSNKLRVDMLCLMQYSFCAKTKNLSYKLMTEEKKTIKTFYSAGKSQ